MKHLAICLISCLAAIAVVAAQNGGPSANLHYAYQSVQPKQGEQLEVNWNGTIIWNKMPKQDGIWIQKGGRVLMITDKATLDAMNAATEPLRYSHLSDKLDRQDWQKARAAERNRVYAATDKIVEQALAKGLAKPTEMP